MVERAVRLFVGDDIFISYARADGSTYAAGLASALAERGFSCRFDQWGSAPGKAIPTSILRALRRSGLLVVVGTRAAGLSERVKEEIEAFLRTKRLIVPIDTDGSLKQSAWWPLLEGLPPTSEGTEVAPSRPSDGVLDRIENSITFTRRNRRLQRFAIGAATVFAALSGGAVVAGLQVRASRQEAERQHWIAASGQLANRAAFGFSREPRSFESSLNLAVEAAAIADAIHVPLLEADSALRGGLRLLPRARGTLALPPALHPAGLSPDGKQVAMLTDDSERRLVVLGAQDGRVMFEAPCPDCQRAALSGRGLVAVQIGSRARAIDVWEMSGSSRWSIPLEEPQSTSFALSPDGRFLVVAQWTDSVRANGGDVYDSAAEVWDVAKKKSVAQLDLDRMESRGVLQVTAVAFSPSGDRVAIGGEDYGPMLGDLGCALVWKVPASSRKAAWEREEPFFSQESFFPELAIGDEGGLLASATAESALIWLRSPDEGARVVARVPSVEPIAGLAFQSGKPQFLTLENGGLTNEVKTWDTFGYMEEVAIPYEEFQDSPDEIAVDEDAGVVAASGQTAVGDAWGRSWRLTDGTERDGGVVTVPRSPDGLYQVDLELEGDEDVDESGLHRVLIRDASGARTVGSVASEALITTYAVSPTGAFVAVGDKAGLVQVLEIATGLTRQMKRFAPIAALTFSADERRLATGDASGLVVVTEASTGDDLVRLERAGSIERLAFSASGRYLAVLGGGLQVHTLSMGDLLREAKERRRPFQRR